MKGDRRGAAAARHYPRKLRQPVTERSQLVVDRDPQRLEGAGRRVDVARPGLARDRGGNDLGELARGRDPIAAPRGVDGARDRSRVPPLAAGPRAPASSSASACPPPPRVPSRMTFPGAAASSEAVSRRSTGWWANPFICAAHAAAPPEQRRAPPPPSGARRGRVLRRP